MLQNASILKVKAFLAKDFNTCRLGVCRTWLDLDDVFLFHGISDGCLFLLGVVQQNDFGLGFSKVNAKIAINTKLEPTRMPAVKDLFNQSPYPRKPLEAAPFDDWNALFLHSVITPRYRRDRAFRPTDNLRILDVGCGSGWKTLMLAAANPGAQILAIDPSPTSVDLAKRRIAFHHVAGVEFRVASLEDLPKIAGSFDYINCDELIYLLPDPNPANALRLLRGMLAPGGILRFNLHSRLQREGYFRGQTLFRLLGLMEPTPGEIAASSVAAFMQGLDPNTELKKKTWIPAFESPNATEHILMNFLLEGDKGYDIADLFKAIDDADLGFISMVNWDQWQLERLFQNAEIPPLLAKPLLDHGPSFALRVFELLQPIHRRLDVWTGRKSEMSAELESLPFHDNTILMLHPVLQAAPIHAAAISARERNSHFNFSDFIKVSSAEPLKVAADDLQPLLSLWDSPYRFCDLIRVRSLAFRNLIERLEKACLILRCE